MTNTQRVLAGLVVGAIALVVALPVLDSAAAERAAAGTSRVLAAAAASPAPLQNARPLAAGTFRSATGGWSAEVPADWNVFEEDAAAIFRSYDSTKVGFDRDRGNAEVGGLVPPGHVRIDVSVFPASKPVTARQGADGNLSNADPSSRQRRLVSRRDDLVIAGQPGTLLIVSSTQPGIDRTTRLYFAVSPGGARLFMIQVNPDNTTRAADVDRFISTFQIQ